MIEFYYNTGPNPLKVALFLEEAGLAYTVMPIDTRLGQQFATSFLKVNPNGKVPAIVDGDVTVFDSNAILLYLAEKTGRFLPQDTPAARGEMLSWLMFVATGVGPYSGQSVHFRHFAPENAYATNRYRHEVERHYELLDRRLSDRPYLLGETYTLVDMALWGWARMLHFVVGQDAWAAFPHVRRLYDEISARPAAKAAEALGGKYTFKKEMDEEARRNLFPSNRSEAS